MWDVIYAPENKSTYLFLPRNFNYTTIYEGTRTDDHRHNVYHFMFVVEGSGFLEHDSGTHALSGGDLLLIDPKAKHVLSAKDRHLVYVTFNFYLIPIAAFVRRGTGNGITDVKKLESMSTREPLADLFPLKLRGAHVVYDASRSKDIRILIDGMLRDRLNALIEPGEHYADDLAAHGADALCFFSHLVAALTTRTSSPERRTIRDTLTRRIIDYLSEHVEEKYSLADLSAKVRYSKSHICGHFHKATGFSVSAFFLRLKVDRAARYLRTSSRSITDIAYQLGFSSSQHFSRAFRAQKKMTPREYREQAI